MRPVHQIAEAILADWTNPPPEAMTCIQAMQELAHIDDPYVDDDAYTIVSYFLARAGRWSGPVARATKAELLALLRAAA